MTIEAVISYEQLSAYTDRAPVSFVWVLHEQRFQLGRKPYRKILRMLDKTQTVAGNEEPARITPLR